ncbi:Mrp/NBP35 family ATP-binding protein [Sphingomonas bacterium]|uniref:Mrp/NBP35 family ATP-binding protein n=1 Tax=Sphingomonas bacterium TaxID=1895847 RepID=UPI0015766D04|nr:Mrp/NBP35 family ATP-binding protein [Sphingomonas bacterium]
MTQDKLTAALSPLAGVLASARLTGGRADVILDVTGLAVPEREALEAQVRAAAATVPGVDEVRVAMTSERAPGHSLAGEGHAGDRHAGDRPRRLIAVASGKGGVGKSTLAANLAVALARAGRRVGLVDADIYGPSQPRLMAAEGERPQAREKVMIPVATRWGVPMLSMGQLVEPGRAVAWRGPMAAGALGQMVDADWGATGTLLLDLPPGTGDIQLTMIQKHRPAGAVIVSTPQDLALIDAARAIDLFRTAGIPIVGLVENMAGYACPSCGAVSDPFGRGGAEAAAGELGIPFLGRVPLDIAIRRASDAGEPPAALAGDTVFAGLAGKVAAWLDAH